FSRKTDRAKQFSFPHCRVPVKTCGLPRTLSFLPASQEDSFRLRLQSRTDGSLAAARWVSVCQPATQKKTGIIHIQALQQAIADELAPRAPAENFLRRTDNPPAQLVLDPFADSGSTCVGANAPRPISWHRTRTEGTRVEKWLEKSKFPVRARADDVKG